VPQQYHGTTLEAATAMAASPGTIDVRRGAGEFGRGFYTQSSVSNAMRWARGRSPNGCVLSLQINDNEFARLDRRILDLKQAARFSRTLRGSKATATYTMGCDVIEGPLGGYVVILQWKYESDASQALLNDPQTMREVLP
jgi:hypothetical protein